MSVQGQNYFANMVKAPQILQGSPNYNVEVSEGQTPPGEFYPAHYLPTVLSENRIAGSAFVLMPGKVVSYDFQKKLIPAGLAVSFNQYKAAYNVDVANFPLNTPAQHHAYAQSDVNNLTSYTARDVENGVVGINGAYVVEGDYVEEALMDTVGYKATDPIGIMRYAALTAPGTNPSNPATFFKHSYDTGGARAYTRWAYIQVPVVEVNARTELCVAGSTGNMLTNQKAFTHRIRLYPSGSVIVTNAAGAPLTTSDGYTFAQVANSSLFETDEVNKIIKYMVQGRTVVFSEPIGAKGGDAWHVSYAPKVDLPFTCVKYAAGSGVVGESFISDAVATFVGEKVGFDYNSDFALQAGSVGSYSVGRILDIKNGSNDDLKLVRTYFRDYGLWAEQPGSATDGRNTQLSIANAPKWIVRIAVNFENLTSF